MHIRISITFYIILGLLIGCLETVDETIDKNQLPKADAGPDQTIDLVGEQVKVTLDGSKSEDVDGKIVKYIWKGAPGITIMDAGIADGGAINGNGEDGEQDDAGDSDGEAEDGGLAEPGVFDGRTDEEDLPEAGVFDGETVENAEALVTPDPEDIVKPRVTLGEGVHTFTLWVTDNNGATSTPDVVVVTIVKSAAR